MARSRPVSYAWALATPWPVDLSETEQAGLEYARELAEDARTRKDQLLHRETSLAPLTIEDIADGNAVPASTVRRRITVARRALYGQLSDGGIYYRLRRERELQARSLRRCRERKCRHELPQNASAARQYCDEHNSPAVRVERHRQKNRAYAQPKSLSPP
jgi:hypothetical protein